MYRFILKRLLMLIPVLLGVSFIVYTILSFTPGDPVQMMLGDNYSEESYAAMQEELGLDDPFLVQYGRFIINAVHGDFGTSYSTGNPVAAEIAARLPNTILLSACAMLFAILIGIPLGVISATHQYSAVDNISMVGALFGVSMPNFWLGLMLIVIFAAGLGWFPSSNFETWGALVLPAVTLSANSLAMITRMTRSSMLETIRQDYIRTARAKGLKESVITIRHALRNAMIPIVTTVGLQFGFSLGGAVLVETVFSWPGIGRLLVDSINEWDFPMILGCVITFAFCFSIINLVVDLLYVVIDPRIRSQFNRLYIKKNIQSPPACQEGFWFFPCMWTACRWNFWPFWKKCSATRQKTSPACRCSSTAAFWSRDKTMWRWISCGCLPKRWAFPWELS